MNNKHKTHESPKPKTESLRTKIICDLHKIFCDDFESDDMELTQAAMNAVIKHHKLKFLEPRDIDACFFLLDISDIENSFYDAINCQRCLDLAYFAIQCEAYIDFTEAVRKENAARYGAHAMYHVLLVKGKEASEGDGKLRA